MSERKEFRLPDVGEGLTEAEIVTWRVATGDTVQVNDIVVEIETAKSLVELPCPYAGTVAGLLVAEGATVAVGTPIIAVSTGATVEAVQPSPDEPVDGDAGGPGTTPGDVPQVEAVPAQGAVEPGLIGGPAPGGRTSVLVGYGPRTTEAKRRPRTAPAVPPGPAAAAAQRGVQSAFSTAGEKAPEPSTDEATPAAPAAPASARAAALSARPGGASGGTPGAGQAAGAQAGQGPGRRPRVARAERPGWCRHAQRRGGGCWPGRPGQGVGQVVEQGVEQGAGQAAAITAGTAVSAGGPAGAETRVPVRGVRKMTAQAMVASAFTAPHVTEWTTLDVTRTVRLLRRLRQQRQFHDVKLSPLLVVAKAVCLAVRRTPELNASWDEQAQEIVLKHDINLGIAAATPRGLLVPNVKGADRLGLRELADALAVLTSTARDGRTQPAETSGGTFTITNVGVFGIDAGTPILNPGETGILCMGAIDKRPWVVGGKVKPRWVTTLAVSFDHRVVDGEQGARFLADVAAVLHDPASALAL